MRYLGLELDGAAMIGAVTDLGVRPLSGIDEFYSEPHGAIARLSEREPVPLHSLRQVPPVPRTSRIFCLGLNYQDHIDEIDLPGRDRPAAPNVFGRWYESLSVDGSTITVPSGEPGLDWECEMAVVIGRGGADIDEASAMEHVLGYSAFNDISARTYQRRTSQFTLGKNADGSGAIGPVVVTAEEYGDPYGRAISTRVNGETMQSSTTDLMIFKVAETIAYISRVLTLKAGDLIAMGTPDGVGIGRDPVVLMHAGDVVEVELEGVGVLTTHIG